MKIILGCECSGIVRDAFIRAGHDAVSVDLKPCKRPGPHIQDDIFNVMSQDHFDIGIFFPPCTYLAKCQMYRCVPSSFYWDKQQEALDFIKRIYNSSIPRIAIENPSGALTKLWRPPDQIVRPWWFGDIHSKEICLWLKNLPPLIATCYNTKRIPVVNHVNGRMSQELKSEIKSTFFPLVANAMALQWGSYHF